MTWPMCSRIVLLLLAFGIALNASEYLTRSPEEFAFVVQRLIYAERYFWLYLHVSGGIIALTCGALQFFPHLRARRALHRTLGWLYAAGVTIGALTSTPLVMSAYAGISNTVAFGLLATLWIYTTIKAIQHARNGDKFRHRIWMLRSYALTFAAVTLRAELGILIGLFGLSLQEAYLIVPWTSWVLNLIAVEWFLSRRTETLGMTHRSGG